MPFLIAALRKLTSRKKVFLSGPWRDTCSKRRDKQRKTNCCNGLIFVAYFQPAAYLLRAKCSMAGKKQVAVTVAFGANAERLGSTFVTFAENPHLELHAFIIGDRLPQKQVTSIQYHLRPPDSTFAHPLRDAVYRRWLFIDELDADYAIVVDNRDVLCMQSLPQLPDLLRGAAVGGCVEHEGGRYIPGQGYISSYINCGVTFWDIKASRKMREEVVARGRSYFRNIDDQRSINEVVQTRYYDDLILLPCQYNYRANLAPTKTRNWPTVRHLDGVKIYHNGFCLEAAKQLIPTKARAELPDFPADIRPLTPSEQFWRRVKWRLKPHVVGKWFG